MKKYELALVLRSSLTETERKKVLETVKGLFKGAKITKEEEWGQKPLSYPIKRENSGFYVYMALEGEDFSTDIDKRFNTNENILRYLLLKI